ncbi:MAG: NAD-dependent epimerase/dehydratase family protein [Cuniculiplasma sp.]
MKGTYLITGGEGFIGRNIKQYLQKNKCNALTLDTDGKPDYMISVTDFHSLIDIDEELDGIFHLAATTSPPQFEDDPLGGFQVNANGTLNVLEFAKRKRIRRVVLASSSATYGNSESVSIEDIAPKTYSSLYPITKVVDEYLARYYSVRKEVECISLRYFNTYGMGENSKAQYASVVWRFITDLQNNRVPVIFGNGEQSRDFIYVEDTARASVLAMERGKSGESYNIGTGITTNFNDIYRMVAEEMHSGVQADHIPNPLRNYQYFTQADIAKARRELKFVPEFDLRTGIRKMVTETKSI